MRLLVSDANILIDMEDGGLTETMFERPFQYCVPDILYAEELEQRHSHLLDAGLQVAELSAETISYVVQLTAKYGNPSRNDCMALALARQESCSLLSGDRALRNAAKAEQVTVMGTLWLVEQMLKHSLIAPDQAQSAYDRMLAAGSRLPARLIDEQLAEFRG